MEGTERTPSNPLRDAPDGGLEAEPCAVVIFGASGDLTQRKLVPALYNLHLDRLLPGGCSIVGAARREMSDDAFAATLEEALTAHSRRAVDPVVWKEFARTISYIQCSFDDPEGYRRLASHLESLDRLQGRGGNRLYYLATPPSAFPVIVRRLDEAGLARPGPGGRWARIVVEKPFGRDLATARELNRTLQRVFAEPAIFRIDHYLGKETVQNLLVFRFANAILEPLWNQKYLSHVQVTVAESIGIEGRGEYYEEAGTTRDMVQNHLFQLLSLIAMEPPASFEADSIRDEKVKVLRSLRPVPPELTTSETVRAQYAEGVVGGERVPGYREEPGVASDSRTETYVAMRLYIDNWRWAGVPFYLRAAKRMPKRATEIALQFREVPHRLFKGAADGEILPNVLSVRIQPDEGITLKVGAKAPGPTRRILPVAMDFRYGTSFGEESPEAYEVLILDAILGDSTLFIRSDEVEASWAWIDALHDGWRRDGSDASLPSYRSGTWGPSQGDSLLARDGWRWRRL